MGITSTGLGMGMLIVPALSQFLIDRTDWRTAFLLLAVPFTVVLIVAAVIIRGRPTRVCVDKSVEFETSPSEVSREDNHTGLRTQITRRFALVFVGWVLIFGPLYVLFGHLAAYSGDLGLPQWVGAISLSVIGASGIIARLAVGRISDRVGVVRPFVGSAAIMGLVPLILPLASRELTLLALAALFGIGYGGVDALLSPLVAALFQDTSVYSLLGVMSLSFALSGLLAPYLAGITFDILGSYVPAFLAVGFVGLCGSSVVFIVSRLSAV
jgi:MFS family permease